jgi:hypothetical protein
MVETTARGGSPPPAPPCPAQAVERALAFVGAAIPGSRPRDSLHILISKGHDPEEAAKFLTRWTCMLHGPSEMVH